MAKTLNEAGVKRLIQEIKGANKNLNTPIPISTDNTPESMAQNVTNIADYVEKAKAAGIANVNGMAVTCIIDGDYSGVGYLFGEDMICGTTTYDDLSTPYNFVVQPDGLYTYNPFIVKGTTDLVTSVMLNRGARRPIIITGDMTEVDENTYQKLSQEGTDVILNLGGGTFVELQGIFNTGDTLNLVFGYSQFVESNDGAIATYTISVNTSAPHTLTLAAIGSCEPVSKSTLTTVLQEIDLTGTDADRKAKLDQFETDWKALTGASDILGARFVGRVPMENGEITFVILNYDMDSNYSGISMTDSEETKFKKIVVSPVDGSVTSFPLFSHLEPVEIFTDNTTESKKKNIDNLNAYKVNLENLGVDGSSSFQIPIYISSGRGVEQSGFLVHSNLPGVYKPYSGLVLNADSVNFLLFGISKTGEFIEETYYLANINYSSLTTTSKKVIPAINEVNALVEKKADKSLNAKSLEAIAIKTDNSTANVAAINAYVDNLKLLGVDTTKGYEIPILYNSGSKGFIGYNPNAASSFNGYAVTPEGNLHTLTMNATTGALSNKILATTAITDALSTNKQPKTDAALKTTSKTVTGAINEVNDKTAYMAFTDVTKLSTNLGKRLIYKGGNVTLSSPITINSNINEIDFNGATLSVGSLAKTGISVITGHSHCIIKNLIVSGTWSVNTDVVNNIIDTFAGVENVSIKVVINGTHYGRGFNSCQRLINCKAEIYGTNITAARAYNYCDYLYMCRVGANSKGTGFFHCTSMDSCDIFNGGCTGSELIECSKYTKVSYYVSGNRRYFSDVDNISTKTLQINGINIANIAELSNVIANSSESVNSVPIIDPNDKSIQKMGVVIGNADNGGTGYSDNPTVVVRNTSGNIFINDGHYNGIGCTTKYAAYLVEQNKTDISGKQDKLISGTNIKTINNQTLLGSGNITISGGGSGDVTAAGDNTFTGNNVFSGIAIADILDGTQYQITGDNGVLMFTKGATNDDIEISGVATPTYSNSAANKSYVDTQISTALGTVLTQLQNI